MGLIPFGAVVLFLLWVPGGGARAQDSGAAGGEFRTWTSRSGSTIEARLVEVAGPEVRLQSRDGRTFQIRLDALSDGDRALLVLTAPAAPPAAPVRGDLRARMDKWTVPDLQLRQATLARAGDAIRDALKDVAPPGALRFRFEIFAVPDREEEELAKMLTRPGPGELVRPSSGDAAVQLADP
jgi:hypothetical protein